VRRRQDGGAGERPTPVIDDPAALQLFAQYQLTPAVVKGYSSEGNSIHYEQAAAEQAGFRAPLIGGGMGVHYLMAQLWQMQAPQQFAMDIYFRRPIFWDEQVQVGVAFAESAGDAAAAGATAQTQPRAMALLKPDGKIGTELALHLAAD